MAAYTYNHKQTDETFRIDNEEIMLRKFKTPGQTELTLSRLRIYHLDEFMEIVGRAGT